MWRPARSASRFRRWYWALMDRTPSRANWLSRSLHCWIDSLLLPPLLGGDGATATLVLANTISVTVVLITITTLQVIFGELFPKSVAIQYPEQIAEERCLANANLPEAVRAADLAVQWQRGAYPAPDGTFVSKEGHSHAHSPEEIELLVTESHEGGLLDDIERQLLRNAFRLRDLTARQVMLHRTKVAAAPEDSTVLEVLNLAIDARGIHASPFTANR